MANRIQKLQASCDLILELAKGHAGELQSDVEYGARVVSLAPQMLAALEEFVRFRYQLSAISVAKELVEECSQ